MNHLSSKIFWHFTGSPPNVDWGQIKTPRDILTSGTPKDSYTSFKILIEIIQDKKLKASARERIYGKVYTDKFCCVTDLPLSYLDQHKKFYGDVAIGYHSKKIYESFNPILYMQRPDVIRNAIEFVDSEMNIDLKDLGITHEDAIKNNYTLKPDGTYSIPSQRIQYARNTVLEKFLLNHIKASEFSDEPNESFYQEKEWRKIGDFYFDYEDIRALLVPNSLIKEAISFVNQLSLPHISILSWDFILKI